MNSHIVCIILYVIEIQRTCSKAVTLCKAYTFLLCKADSQATIIKRYPIYFLYICSYMALPYIATNIVRR